MNLIKSNRHRSPMRSSLFDDFFGRGSLDPLWDNFRQPGNTIPSTNIRETEDNYEVEMAAPGLKKEDFNVELDGNTLTISCDREHSEEKKEDGYSRREFSFSAFSRSFELPNNVVDEERINAHYEDGILKLLIPKREEAKARTPRHIDIT
ncbi:Hsp20/alpha crystallin family protein [Parapedobacter sp. DT-150]|uniref:Hsp20/alpha crystallin family protein n=1 Tax=Parapedobacter sp. DT-150 TaxID=3396162 RepID=UPI003F198F8B